MSAPRGAPALLVLLVGGLAAAALGQPGEAEPPARPVVTASEASGSVSLVNSLDGGAILSVTDLAPGQSTSGEVTITNAGSLTGAVTLESDALAELPGLGGGLLSERLELVVLEPGVGVVYQGPYGGLDRRSLGSIAAGQGRRYRFTATLPDGGVPPSPSEGDNAYQGARLTSAFRWTAASAPTPDGPTRGSTAPGSELALSIRLLRRQPSPRRRRLVFYARCNRACAVSARAKMRGGRSKLTRRRSVGANQRMKVSLRLSRRSAQRLARAVARRRGARLMLSVKARDDAGGRAAFARRLQLRQVRRGGRALIVARWRGKPR